MVFIWGSTWMAIKVSVGNTPFYLAGIRFFLAACMLIIIQRVRGRAIFPTRENMKVILAIGLGNFFLGYGFTYWGMQFVESNVTSILWATLPVMVTITAHFKLKDEKINLAKIFSLVGSLVGTFFIFDIGGHDFDPQVALGMAFILVSIFAAAFSNVIYKRDGSHLDPLSINIAGMLVGASLLILVGLVTEPWMAVDYTMLRVGATVYLAMFGSAMSFSIYFWLLKRISVVKMSYSTFLIPILAGIWGWVILGESLSSKSMLGAAIILLAVSLPELKIFKRNRTNG